MPVRLFGMNVEERAEYLALMDRERKTDRSSGFLGPEEIRTTGSPETHLIRFPEIGIPPLSQSIYGTSSGSNATDSPGRVVCDVMRVHLNHTTTQYELEAVPNYQLTVCNITPSYIFAGYGIATREKYGDWLVSAPWITQWQGVTAEAIASKGSGKVNIWPGEAVSSPLWQVTAWLRWMNGSSAIAIGKEVIVTWFQGYVNADGTLGRWIITERQCP